MSRFLASLQSQDGALEPSRDVIWSLNVPVRCQCPLADYTIVRAERTALHARMIGDHINPHCQTGHAVPDRTRSPGAISQKREYSKCPPETIGFFALGMPNMAVQRLTANLQKPAIGGPFCEYQGNFL